MPKASWELEQGKSILAWRRGGESQGSLLEETAFEVGLETGAASGHGETAGMTGPKRGQGDTGRRSTGPQPRPPGQASPCLPGFLHSQVRRAAEGSIWLQMNPRVSGTRF